MPLPGVRGWIAALLIALAMYSVYPHEPELLPAAPPGGRLRSWLGRLRERRRFSFWGADDDDAEQFVSELRGEDRPLALPPAQQKGGRHAAPKVRVSRRELELRHPEKIKVDFPCMQPSPRTSLVTSERPPWEKQAPDPVRTTGPHAWQPGDPSDPPTDVRMMRLNNAADPDGVENYLGGLPRYDD